jgi:hypothetical protein
MLLQPKYWVRIPPITGPQDSPRYVAVILIPMARPLSPGWKTEVRIAILVPNIIALEKP